MVQLDFDHVAAVVFFETISALLGKAPIIGTPPDCTVTVQSAPMPMDELMLKLNQAFSIRFVQTAEGYRIFVPYDTERLCTVAFSG